jgi:hypothetical protein
MVLFHFKTRPGLNFGYQLLERTNMKESFCSRIHLVIGYEEKEAILCFICAFGYYSNPYV